MLAGASGDGVPPQPSARADDSCCVNARRGYVRNPPPGGFSFAPEAAVRAAAGRESFGMDNVWFASALWIGLALVAASLQAWVAVSVALLEIVIGAVAGNLV